MKMYEVTSQILWYPQYPSHANNENSDQLYQGVEPIKHWLMMVDTNCEDGSNRTRVNMSELRKMDPTMVTASRTTLHQDSNEYSIMITQMIQSPTSSLMEWPQN